MRRIWLPLTIAGVVIVAVAGQARRGAAEGAEDRYAEVILTGRDIGSGFRVVRDQPFFTDVSDWLRRFNKARDDMELTVQLAAADEASVQGLMDFWQDYLGTLFEERGASITFQFAQSSVDAPSVEKFNYVIVLENGREYPGAMIGWRQGIVVGLIYVTAPERPIESYMETQIRKIDAAFGTPVPTRTPTRTPTAAPTRTPTATPLAGR